MTESTAGMQALRRMMAGMFGQTHGGNRDVWNVLGYPQVVTIQNMWSMYLRGGMASRIIRAFPQATWREHPVISDENGNSEDPESDDYSPFVADVSKLLRDFAVLKYMERADRLSSIGQFGVMFLGFNDGGRAGSAISGAPKLAYLSAYGEPNAKITKFVTDQRDPRFGMPDLYSLQSGSVVGGKSQTKQSITAHSSRIVHFAEHLDEDEVYGTPRLLPIYNHLMDLEKVLGSSAETFWLNARGGMSLDANPEADLSPADLQDIRDQALEFEHQLRRTIALQGVTAKMLTTPIADPGPNVEALLDVIAGSVGIPKRILLGSERGELSSAQDENNWAARIDERQNNHAVPSVLVPFIDLMIRTKNVSEPRGDWNVEFPESAAMSPTALAEIASKRSTALVAYGNSPGAETVVPRSEFRSEILGLPAESPYADEMEEEDLDEDDEEVQEQFGDDEESSEEPVTNLAQYRKRIRANASPRSLYVRRDILNAEDIRAHFKKQGVNTMTPVDEMHVTVMFSRQPVDWFKIEAAWNQQDDGKLLVPPGGARMMSLFGKDFPRRCLVLQFSAVQLSWRHQDMVMNGCSYDWPTYEPHITISYDLEEATGDSDMEATLERLVPWQGPISLGPEIWQEINDDWKSTLVENRVQK